MEIVASAVVAEGLAPSQPASMSRQLANLSDYTAFLPRELQLLIDAGPGCGGVTWPAALVLSRYLAYRLHAEPALYQGATALELGSGTGCVSLCLAMMQPRLTRVVATDIDALLPLMRENVDLNGLADLVKVEELSWGGGLPGAIPRQIDLLLLADCVYLESAFPLLLATMNRLLGDRTECLFCYKKRRKADKHFFIAARKLFNFSQVTDDPHRETYQRDSIFLYRVTRRTPLAPAPS